MVSRPSDATYAQTLSEAVATFSEQGYQNPEQLAYWTERLRRAADRELIPEQMLQDNLRSVLTASYKRLTENEGWLSVAPGVSKFTIDRLRPEMRRELDKRIVSSANLIKLNRDEAINATLRRFQGWATSIPEGGTPVPQRKKTTKEIKKSLSQLRFEERRVLVDQTAKLNAAISEVIATGTGAIAAYWESHYRQPNYDYRHSHKDRDWRFRGKNWLYLIPDTWATKNGLVKPGPAGWTSDITQPGEEVFCRCKYRYVYNLHDLPSEMLTRKGQEAMEEAKRQRVA